MPIKLVNIFFIAKYFSYIMKQHIIYFATDANRINIEVGYCTNMADIKFNRIVYMEKFNSFEEAQQKKLIFHTYTRMMKERIIRRYNPNWLNIVRTPLAFNTPKKIVAYAF